MRAQLRIALTPAQRALPGISPGTYRVPTWMSGTHIEIGETTARRDVCFKENPNTSNYPEAVWVAFANKHLEQK